MYSTYQFVLSDTYQKKTLNEELNLFIEAQAS